MSDERLKKSLGNEGRASRAMEDRAVTERRDLSDDDRIRMFNEQHFQNALSDLPKIPGYHVFWASLTNERDTIQQRMRWGYELIKAEEIPGWDLANSVKSGTLEGAVSINEMVAMKIKDELYRKFMMINHHEKPQAEQGLLADQAENMREDARRRGSDLMLGDGTAALRQAPRAPVFVD